MHSTFLSQNCSQAKIYRRMGMRRLPASQNEQLSSGLEEEEIKIYLRRAADPILVDAIGNVFQSLRTRPLFRNTSLIDGNTESPSNEPCDHFNAITTNLIQVVEDMLYCMVRDTPESPKEFIENSIAANFPHGNDKGSYIRAAHVETVRQDLLIRELSAKTDHDNLKDTKQDVSFNSSAMSENRNICILVIGLDGAGKSTLISTLKGNLCSSCRPTLGFCPVLMKYELLCTVNLFDIGGGAKIRGIWKNYFHDVHGVIYVFDVCCEDAKFEESIVVARQTLKHALLRNKPLLFVCNKKSEMNARSSDFVQDCILKPMNNISPCSTLETNLYHIGDAVQSNVDSSIKWLIQSILGSFTELSERIAVDTKAKTMLMIQDQLEKDRRALKNMICKAFGVGGEDKVETFSVSEGEQFLATELGLDCATLPKEASEVAALVGYERYALMIIGGMACPISRRKRSWTWSEIKHYVLSITDEIFSIATFVL